MVLRMSGFSTSSSRGSSLPPFLIFSLDCVATRQSATAAANTAMSAGRAACAAASISRAVSTRTTFTPGGSAIGGPADERHLARPARAPPRRWRALLAGRAVGDVAHRVDGLVRRAGGDQDAPAGERQAPRGSPPPCGAGLGVGDSCRAQAAFDRVQQLGRLGQPAGAGLAALGHLADVGPDECTPSACSVATLRRVAGLSHMRGFMAGATSTGLSVAISTDVARSSAWPPAILASRSAVAGATTIRSASRDRRMWPISRSSSRSNSSVKTRSPVSAPTESGVTNSCAARS